MTEQEIDALPAGRELDAVVARDVLGARLVPVNTGFGNVRGEYVYHFCLVFPGVPSDSRSERATEAAAWDLCPAYSTDIAAAFLIWDRCAVGERWYLRSDEDGAAILVDRGEYRAEPVLDEATRAATIPLAICRAALRRYRPLTRYWTR